MPKGNGPRPQEAVFRGKRLLVTPRLPMELALCLFQCYHPLGPTKHISNQIHNTKKSSFQIPHLCHWLASCLTIGFLCSQVACRTLSLQKDKTGALETGKTQNGLNNAKKMGSGFKFQLWYSPVVRSWSKLHNSVTLNLFIYEMDPRIEL